MHPNEFTEKELLTILVSLRKRIVRVASNLDAYEHRTNGFIPALQDRHKKKESKLIDLERLANKIEEKLSVE